MPKLLTKIQYPVRLLRTISVTQIMRLLLAKLKKRQFMQIQPRACRNRVWLRPNSTDIKVLYGIFGRGELDMEWPLDHHPCRIIDAGANVGYATIAMKQRWPDAQIIAVEPDPDNFAMLKKNCEELPGVSLVQAGIWSKECRLQVRPASRRGGAWALSFEEMPNEANEGIPALTISGLLDKFNWQHCDLLKVDVEGAEEEIFAAGDLAWILQIRTILVETHGAKAEEVIRRVSKHFKFESGISGEKVFLWRHAQEILEG